MNKLTRNQKKLLITYFDALLGVMYILTGIAYLETHYKAIIAEETGSSADTQQESSDGQDCLS